MSAAMRVIAWRLLVSGALIAVALALHAAGV